MINANEAKANVINYEAALLAALDEKINELVDIMGRSIEYHSKNGFTSIQFCPYEKSRFTNVRALEYAQKRFTEIFEEAGYTVVENHYGKNIIKIEW